MDNPSHHVDSFRHRDGLGHIDLAAGAYARLANYRLSVAEIVGRSQIPAQASFQPKTLADDRSLGKRRPDASKDLAGEPL